MFLTFALISSVLVLILVQLTLKRFRNGKHLLKLMDQFDGPPVVPIFGNALDLIGDITVSAKKFMNYAREYKSPFGLWIFNLPFVAIGKPEDIKIIASKNLEKDDSYRFLADLLGNGLITCSKEEWKRRRRIVDPAFSEPVIRENYLPIFNAHLRQLVKKLEKKCDNQDEGCFDVWSFIAANTFTTTTETTMGSRINQQDDANLKMARDAYYKASILVGKRIYQPWLYSPLLFKIYQRLIGWSSAIEDSRSIPVPIILEKKSMRMNRLVQNEKGHKNNLVDILLSSSYSDHFNEREMIDEVLTVFFAANETTAITTSFLLLMLAIHPDIQTKVYDEINAVFKDSDRMAEAEDLSKLHYLEQCLMETMRWSSIVAMIVRVSNEDIEITDGYVIPAGAKIVVATYIVHHDESIYPEPFKWNPDNFHPDRVAGRHPYAFIPFGIRPRMCIGYKYALLSIKATVSTLLRNFKLTTDLADESEIDFTFDFIFRKDRGYPLRLEYRHGRSIF